MARRRPIIAGEGQTVEPPAADRLTGTRASRIAVASGGSVSATIPAGLFTALPVTSRSPASSGYPACF
jgi:hypothetical protein